MMATAIYHVFFGLNELNELKLVVFGVVENNLQLFTIFFLFWDKIYLVFRSE